MAPGAEKKRKIDENQVFCSSGPRVRVLSDSEMSDSARRVVCISADEERDDAGSGPTPSVLEIVSIVTAWSLAKPS